MMKNVSVVIEQNSGFFSILGHEWKKEASLPILESPGSQIFCRFL